MDLLEEFRRKSDLLSSEDVYEGIQAATQHVQAAERYLSRSRRENDEDLLNDVIYRTNQAYEGMLKEAYTVFTGKDASKLSPNTIEKHLLEEKVFPPRVLALFTNYRQEWRNASTHNHKLFFKDQEALLAIVNVTAFACILLDQMIETINFQKEKEEVGSKEQEIKDKVTGYAALPFGEQVLSLLSNFTEELKRSSQPLLSTHEAEVTGRLSGFISAIDSSIQVLHQPPIRLNTRVISPDLVLVKGDVKVVVELKRPGMSERGLRSAQDQVLSYVEAGDYAFGVVYVPPSFPNQITRTSETTRQVKGRTVPIYTVAPETVEQSFGVRVEDEEGTPISRACILSVADNGTYQQRMTDEEGQAKLAIPTRRLLTVFCAHEAFPAHIERSFDPVDDLTIILPRVENTGSIVCPDGTGHLPGLEGRLEPIRDPSNRLFLYATNIAIEGGKQQPVPFELGVPFEVEDKNGRVFSIKIVEVIGRSSLVEFVEK